MIAQKTLYGRLVLQIFLTILVMVAFSIVGIIFSLAESVELMVAWAIGLIAVMIIGLLAFPFDKWGRNPHYHRILAEGIPAVGMIAGIEETHRYYSSRNRRVAYVYKLRLFIQPPDGLPYDVEGEVAVPNGHDLQMTDKINIMIDPENLHQIVVTEWEQY